MLLNLFVVFGLLTAHAHSGLPLLFNPDDTTDTPNVKLVIECDTEFNGSSPTKKEQPIRIEWDLETRMKERESMVDWVTKTQSHVMPDKSKVDITLQILFDPFDFNNRKTALSLVTDMSYNKKGGLMSADIYRYTSGFNSVAPGKSSLTLFVNENKFHSASFTCDVTVVK